MSHLCLPPRIPPKISRCGRMEKSCFWDGSRRSAKSGTHLLSFCEKYAEERKNRYILSQMRTVYLIITEINCIHPRSWIDKDSTNFVTKILKSCDVSHGELLCTRTVTLIWTGNELLNIKCHFAVIRGSFKLTGIIKWYNLFPLSKKWSQRVCFSVSYQPEERSERMPTSQPWGIALSFPLSDNVHMRKRGCNPCAPFLGKWQLQNLIVFTVGGCIWVSFLPTRWTNDHTWKLEHIATNPSSSSNTSRM